MKLQILGGRKSNKLIFHIRMPETGGGRGGVQGRRRFIGKTEMNGRRRRRRSLLPAIT